MLDFKEYTGKNIDDALTNACVDLGTTTDKLEYEVISKLDMSKTENSTKKILKITALL